jgi:hypothetical protein
MTKNNVWITDAAPEEKGSFCDAQSGRQYDNVSGFEAITQEQSAVQRGDNVEWVDKSVFGLGDESRPWDSVQPDDRYNLYYCEEDSQGVETPSRLGPGR